MRLSRLRRGPAYGRSARVLLPTMSRNIRVLGGVYVPSDSFGGQSPERKAAGVLRTFFTFVAARVVLAQLEGSGRGALGAYDSKAATDLHHFLQNVPLKDGDDWLAQLMRQNTSLGLRLMEVRDHYCDEAFEWDQLQRIARKDMKTANTKLMKQFAAASLAASMAAMEEDVSGSGAGDSSGAGFGTVVAPSPSTTTITTTPATPTVPSNTSASTSSTVAALTAETDAASVNSEAAASATIRPAAATEQGTATGSNAEGGGADPSAGTKAEDDGGASGV